LRGLQRGDEHGFFNDGCLEEQLVDNARNGDKDAFERLMENHIKVIYNYIVHHVGIEEDVKDVMQETMLSIWMSLISFVGKSSFRTWAIAITKRRIADYFRSRYKSQNKPIDDYADVLVDEENGYGRIDNSLSVCDAIDALDSPDKELLFLVFYAQLTYGEVSEVLNVPVGTIKSRMSRIKAGLAKSLEEGNYGYL
jgi:RNA polymerase sigma-70 factor (ECF subfamily)